MVGTEVGKILILRTENIGDYIVSLPAIKKIRQNFPDAEITLIVSQCNELLAKATPYVDKVIVGENFLDKRNLSALDIIKNFTFKIYSYFKFLKLIRQESYDLAVSFSNRKFSKLILPFIKTKKLLSGLDFEQIEEKEIKRCLRVVCSLGKTKNSAIKFKISKEDQKLVNQILKSGHLDKKEIIIAHLLSPLESKNWAEDKWVELIKRLSENKNRVFVLIGSKVERNKLEEIKCKLRGVNVINLSGKLNLVQLAYFMSKGKLYLGIDSGPMHLANLVGLYSIILFGSTNEKIWGPDKKYGKILKKKNINNIMVKDVLVRIK